MSEGGKTKLSTKKPILVTPWIILQHPTNKALRSEEGACMPILRSEEHTCLYTEE